MQRTYLRRPDVRRRRGHLRIRGDDRAIVAEDVLDEFMHRRESQSGAMRVESRKSHAAIERIR